MLDELSDSTHQFHLTGSRFFETDQFDSDWDFFTQNSSEVMNFLEGLGFTRTSIVYIDSNTTEVHSYEDELIAIHIQLEKNVDKKVVIQRVIRSSPTMKDILCTLPKEDRHELWNLFYRIFDSGLLEGRRGG